MEMHGKFIEWCDLAVEAPLVASDSGARITYKVSLQTRYGLGSGLMVYPKKQNEPDFA